MNIEKAKQARDLLDKVDFLKEKIAWMSKDNRILCFCTTRENELCDRIEHDDSFKTILNEHHKRIIKEFENKIEELNNQIENL